MTEDRFRQVFHRITLETPEPPPFSRLETQRAAPKLPVRFRPWMAAVGAAALVLVVIGVFGLLGGGGPDLTAPDASEVDYVKAEYSAVIDPECDEAELLDNQGSSEATIEIWGPTAGGETLMVVTLPDGTSQRTVIEGDPHGPNRIWVDQGQTRGPGDNLLRGVRCSRSTVILPSTAETRQIVWILRGAPAPYSSWSEALAEADGEPTPWLGENAVVYEVERITSTSSRSSEVYIDSEKDSLLRYDLRETYEGLGTARAEIRVIERSRVDSSSVSFDTDGLVAMAESMVQAQNGCPVTIPTGDFTPPEGYPQQPSDLRMTWYGSEGLWTRIPTTGDYVETKSVWWSIDFPGGARESSPPLFVTQRLLGVDRDLTITSTSATNAYTPIDGPFMIANIDPDAGGCWEVTATYKGTSVSYVYYNPGGASVGAGIVPDVRGLTVATAGDVLRAAGYDPDPWDSADPYYQVCAQEPAAGTEIVPGGVVGIRTAPPGGCTELMNPNGLYNRVYTDQTGRSWYGTDCPAADVLISGGIDASDGLPRAGETTRDRVDQLLIENGADLATWPGVVKLETIPRRGEVWDHAGNGDVIVVDGEDDYMIKLLFQEIGECPDAPYFWNGIPVAFIQVDTN